MINSNELQQVVRSLSRTQQIQVECVHFDETCFESTSSEESIMICRGTKTQFPSAAEFWVLALIRSENWAGREDSFESYVCSGLCLPISESLFLAKIAHFTERLKVELPSFLREPPPCIQALQMHDAWNDVAFIAATDQHFITFHWETTA